MNAPAPAIHHDLTYREYARLPGWRWSVIKQMERSPLHVHHARHAPERSSDDQDVLRATHCLVLEPHRFADQFSVFDGSRNPNHRKFQSHLACYPNTTVLTLKGHAKAKRAAEAIRSHPLVTELMSDGHPEVVVTWTDEATGLLCKARIDWLATAWFFDLKNLGTTNERVISARVAQHLWHGQLAHYADGLRANGRDVPAHLVVAEGKGPQDVAVLRLLDGAPDGPLHVGARKRAELMERLAECVKRDAWPGRHAEIADLVLPAWAIGDRDEIGADEEPDEDSDFTFDIEDMP